jgi:hypothetical protein
MNSIKIIALVLIVAGFLSLIYGSFTFTKDSHDAKLGPIEFSFKEKQTIKVPVLAGLGIILVGGTLLVIGARKS